MRNNEQEFVETKIHNVIIHMQKGIVHCMHFKNGEITHKVDSSEASMTDLPQVCEELLRVLPEEQLSHLRVLQAPGPHTRRHGQRLDSAHHTSRVTFLLFVFLKYRLTG